MRARRADGGSSAQCMRRARRGVRAVRVDSFMTVDAGRRCRGVASRGDAITGDGCVPRRPLRFGSPCIARRAARVANECGRRFGGDRRARIGEALHSARRGDVLDRRFRQSLRCAERAHKCEHDVAPARFRIPLRDDSEKRGDRLAHGHRLERRCDARRIASSAELPDRDRCAPVRRCPRRKSQRDDSLGMAMRAAPDDVAAVRRYRAP